MQAFAHPDAAYVISFALIMLNTDLHNPSVKKKMSVSAFVQMNRGVNGGANVPTDTLTAMYNSIKVRPLAEFARLAVCLPACLRTGVLCR